MDCQKHKHWTSVSECPDCVIDERDTLKTENEKLREALGTIKNHQIPDMGNSLFEYYRLQDMAKQALDDSK